jgi:hypothetical protein
MLTAFFVRASIYLPKGEDAKGLPDAENDCVAYRSTTSLAAYLEQRPCITWHFPL